MEWKILVKLTSILHSIKLSWVWVLSLRIFYTESSSSQVKITESSRVLEYFDTQLNTNSWCPAALKQPLVAWYDTFLALHLENAAREEMGLRLPLIKLKGTVLVCYSAVYHLSEPRSYYWILSMAICDQKGFLLNGVNLNHFEYFDFRLIFCYFAKQ